MQCVAVAAARGQEVVPQDGASTVRLHLSLHGDKVKITQKTLFEPSFVVACRFILVDRSLGFMEFR